MNKAVTVEQAKKLYGMDEQPQEEKQLRGTLEDVTESLLTLEEQLNGLNTLLETVCREYTDSPNWREQIILRVQNDPARLHTLTRMMWDYLSSAEDEVTTALKKAEAVLDEDKRGA